MFMFSATHVLYRLSSAQATQMAADLLNAAGSAGVKKATKHDRRKKRR